MAQTNETPDLLFVLAGNVPYEKHSQTLAALMRQWLIDKSVPREKAKISRGFEIFSEARMISLAWESLTFLEEKADEL